LNLLIEWLFFKNPAYDALKIFLKKEFSYMCKPIETAPKGENYIGGSVHGLIYGAALIGIQTVFMTTNLALVDDDIPISH